MADGMLEVMHDDFHRFWEIDVNLRAMIRLGSV
jgi:hypothetical protein